MLQGGGLVERELEDIVGLCGGTGAPGLPQLLRAQP